MDIALLLVRLIGLGMAAHGAQKLFGWFGGYGIAGTGGWLESIGFRPGKAFAVAAGASEFAGGLLLALGLGGPLGALLIIAAMVVAIGYHAQGGFFAQKGGYETALLYVVIAFGLAFTGFGAYSLDAALGLTGLYTPTVEWAAVGLGVLGGLANLAIRRKPAA
ncbi:oxidoreductase [Vulcanimicrobium alpinum]|uniref:Oxidoreductase n=1 Tax=Vulcanimicrobium alpinum TaxID=3016050 RepID=A0AAN1XTL0_UNVUL|nr:DoxX family membrane protein [Vulcanimicrobium alpinum]BDE05417.1 oxidoreductase [Vulcanimicrobium alpinum]